MSDGSEIEIKSPDGETSILVRSDTNAVRVTHNSSLNGVNFAAELDLSNPTTEQSLNALNLYKNAAQNPDTNSLTYMRLTQLGNRARYPMKAMSKFAFQAIEWLLRSHEDTNFTYALSDQSKYYLAHTVSLITNTSIDQIQSYIAEAESDEDLQHHISAIASQQPDHIRAVSDDRALFGRRLGWYAVARALKPRFIIETGVDKGLGAILLCAALKRNADEGTRGRYLGTDINPAAGYLLAPPYSEYGHVAYGDSLETLETVTDEIDLFINDSDHSAEYEAREFECITPLLSKDAIVLSDNAHSTTKLAEFAQHAGFKFLFWREQPIHHWYPGAGIGFAFK